MSEQVGLGARGRREREGEDSDEDERGQSEQRSGVSHAAEYTRSPADADVF